MVIGIDETGDFAPGSELLSFFVAVQLAQHGNGIQLKEQQFRAWLATIPPEKLDATGEVKGSNLTEEELLSFAQTVICAKPAVRITYVQFRPSENPEERMKAFKAREVALLERAAAKAQEAGKHGLAKQYSTMAIWHKNAKKMHYQHYMKLLLLRELITACFEKVVGVSIALELAGQDPSHENLLNIEFKIDQDFVRGREPEIFWKELLRTSFTNAAKGIPVLEDWKHTGHPFLDKYQRKEGKGLDFADVFQNHCAFYASQDSFEVQIADITAIIINRFRNRGAAANAYQELWRIFPRSDKPIQVVLNPEVN
ncbi:hypothetical protein EJV47_26405 [Hymenobacter gummosus]|uniref:DUF3800 domain-containing protein n=1 Tax=Hymenobacter gummosus TaxID=1776032 RepID=A0A3S0J5P3_9BACT|nr:hypothetical protein [Hymenobacter gummosus]RTQ45105.1 hypothetical protein EJV47_26405 [Hymenobacter gummosus]